MAREAAQNHHWAWFACSVLMVVVAMALLIWMSVPKWGGQAIRSVAENLYAREGRLLLDPPPEDRMRRRLMWAGVLFFGCVQATVVFGKWIPPHLLQPVSALYVVPFVVFIARSAHGAGSVAHYLWPALYALHALLILAGAPIVFTGKWAPMNIYFPVGAYGAITALAGHLYSRHALKRLKEAAR
jgi:hypothetical protein